MVCHVHSTETLSHIPAHLLRALAARCCFQLLEWNNGYRRRRRRRPSGSSQRVHERSRQRSPQRRERNHEVCAFSSSGAVCEGEKRFTERNAISKALPCLLRIASRYCSRSATRAILKTAGQYFASTTSRRTSPNRTNASGTFREIFSWSNQSKPTPPAQRCNTPCQFLPRTGRRALPRSLQCWISNQCFLTSHKSWKRK